MNSYQVKAGLLITFMGIMPCEMAVARNVPPICSVFLKGLQAVSTRIKPSPYNLETVISGFAHPGFDVVEGKGIPVAEILGRETLPDRMFRFPDWLISQSASGGSRVYSLPLTSNGRSDLVIETLGGTLRCHHYEWYVRDQQNRLVPVRGPDVRGYENEAGLCSESGQSLAMFHEQGAKAAIVVVYSDGNETISGQFMLFRFQDSGKATLLCRVRPTKPSEPIDFEIDQPPPESRGLP